LPDVSSLASKLSAIDRRDTQPLQDQLVDLLRHAVVRGELQPGDRLPPTRSLARELALSRNTVMLAYDRLATDGYLEANRGAGTFVARDLPRARLGGGTGDHAAPARAVALRGRRIVGRRRPEVRADRPLTPGVPPKDAFPFKRWGLHTRRFLRDRPAALVGYGDPQGAPELRRAVSGYLRRHRGVVCDPGQVIVVPGSQAAVDTAARVLLDPGDQVWVEDPGYDIGRSALEAADARLVPVPVDRDGLRVATARARSPQARMAYVTPAHQYPTGAVLSRNRRLELLDWARAADAWIFEDDYDGEFTYASRALEPLYALADDARVVYAGTLSKVLAPGLRIGYVVVPSDLVEVFSAARSLIDRHMPIPQQLIAASFIAGGHLATQVREVRTLYRRRWEAVMAAARRTCGDVLELDDLGAGLHTLATFRDPGIDDRAVARLAWRRGLGPQPVSDYHLGQPDRTGLVLGFANVPCGSAPACLQQLDQAIDATGAGRGAGRGP
jgi:GntR family transcriptional regulator/MocR family aminotransferase